MSTHAAKQLPFLKTEPLMGMLKEFGDKLACLHDRTTQLTRTLVQLPDEKKKATYGKDYFLLFSDCVELLDLWKMVRPAAVRLAQYASQTIEHGRIDDFADMELRLRLPIFEHHLRFLDDKTKRLAEFVKANTVQGENQLLNAMLGKPY